ncbi:adenosine deaminase family protein [Parelusimicrobium proximum]|uniref:adenosine deaminase family protein n=1 Tax=Parelusimicrobium proximum TaxID=3228953 RepID=UPI003D16D355
MRITEEFIREIPKSDLHLHLDGSIRLSTLIELAKKENIKLPATTEKGLKEKVFKDSYPSLVQYLEGFKYTVAVMQSEENIIRIAKELAEDNIAEGVRYIEVRFAPQLHTFGQMTTEKAIKAVVKGLSLAAEKHNKSKEVKSGADIPFHFGIIACAMRSFTADTSPYYAALLSVMSHAPKKYAFGTASMELARVITDMVEKERLPIVGFDLAGQEDGFPAEDHAKAYQYVHEHFIRKTVHAGEAYGPESIFQAITDCHANRIGHGTFLFATDKIKDKTIKDKKRYVNNLANYIANERIGIEVCLTSNLQTNPAIRSLKDHPVREMIKRGLPVTICTDNRTVSNTTVTKELGMLVKNVPLSAKQFRNVVIAGFKGSFFPGLYEEKQKFIKKVTEKYNKMQEKYLIF